MKFTLSIDSENDAMCSRMDVVRALRKLASKLEAFGPGAPPGGRIHDDNGNPVGKWALKTRPVSEDVRDSLHDDERWRR